MLVEMSQQAVVATGLAEVGRGQGVRRRLPLLGRVGRAVSGRLDRGEEKVTHLQVGRRLTEAGLHTAILPDLFVFYWLYAKGTAWEPRRCSSL